MRDIASPQLWFPYIRLDGDLFLVVVGGLCLVVYCQLHLYICFHVLACEL